MQEVKSMTEAQHNYNVPIIFASDGSKSNSDGIAKRGGLNQNGQNAFKLWGTYLSFH